MTINRRQAEIHRATELFNTTEDVGKLAAEHRINEEVALEIGPQEKAKEFVEKGAEVYAKA